MTIHLKRQGSQALKEPENANNSRQAGLLQKYWRQIGNIFYSKCKQLFFTKVLYG
jgi:hypothetical protein